MVDRRIEQALERAVELGEIGIQVAAYQGDELVIDAWIGDHADPDKTPVDGETLFPVFSVSKAFISTAVHLRADRGLLDIDQPIAVYWPEYAAHGKGNITLRHVLQHRGGVPQLRSDLTPERLSDWDGIVEWLADTTPMAPPGERSMYHSLSYGYLLGEVVRRTDPKHRMFGAFLQDEILTPLDIRNLWFGLPADQEPRVATLTWGPVPPTAPQVAPIPSVPP